MTHDRHDLVRLVVATLLLGVSLVLMPQVIAG